MIKQCDREAAAKAHEEVAQARSIPSDRDYLVNIARHVRAGGYDGFSEVLAARNARLATIAECAKVFDEDLIDQCERLCVIANYGQSSGQWRDRARRAAIEALGEAP